MVVESDSGPDPGVCIAISPLGRADWAIESRPAAFSRRESGTPAFAAHTCPACLREAGASLRRRLVEQSGCYWIGRCDGGNGTGRRPSIRRGMLANRVLSCDRRSARSRPRIQPDGRTPMAEEVLPGDVGCSCRAASPTEPLRPVRSVQARDRARGREEDHHRMRCRCRGIPASRGDRNRPEEAQVSLHASDTP